mmetsp:Transcript_2326/g.3338  ORF Transcript_2326/g.3338 Transcript_2326/m.3338 type:complete len:272 (-) Transcript_2326:355-1170(-)|eukprot:CAMPEP_0184479664 /NCGR_PEP_ID=MMETSP0113_2-20130426/1299_1 /TAXON_ID=91329 /ORGANISM="Norrisiella sphaerica, Strain BC52" /LENGTH=271 /DNA_ID=CAMNT_0026857789 /DNA_START=82 /DNA_END=897 /DNA_ORIENTATION=+
MINAGARRFIKSAAVAGGAAAIGSASAEAKNDQIEELSHQPDKHRIIFAPNDEEGEKQLALNRKQLSKIALWEIKDAPKDTLTEMVLSLGEDLAKDPAVQNAVYKKFGIAMSSSIEAGEEMDVDLDPEATHERLEEQLAYLKEELDCQQTLNDQLVYHNERLCEEKSKMTREYAMKLRQAQRERDILDKRLREMGEDSKGLLEKESKEDVPEEDADNKKEDGWSMTDIVVKALAVAAVVILMAVVKKKGVVTVAATSAIGAWGWMRAKMKV